MPAGPSSAPRPGASTRGATLLAGAAAVALLASGCGRSELALEYDAYVERVDPLMEQESKRRSTLADLLQARRTDPASPRFFRYVEEQALPYYRSLREELQALQPPGDRTAESHDLLLRFCDARIEFLHVELAVRDAMAGSEGAGALTELLTGLQEAENLRYEYQEAIGNDPPDAKLEELRAIVDGFRVSYFEPFQQGAIDARRVQDRLQGHVIRALEELEGRKYFDDAPSRLLRRSVRAWLHWHRTLAKVAPPLQRLFDLEARSRAALDESESLRQSFLDSLAAIRRDRG